MKRFTAFVTALVLICSLTACGKDEKSLSDVKKETEATLTQTEAPLTEESEAAEATETTAEAPTDPPSNLTVHDNTYFSIGFDETVGWKLNEDETALKEYGGWAFLELMNSEEERVAWIEVDTEDADHWGFRKLMNSRHFDEKTYADGGYELVDIAGQSLLQYDDGDFLRYYFGRNEAAGVDIEVTVYAEDSESEAEVAAVLESLTFNLPDVGNVDAPWYWEGQPFTAQPKSNMVGTYTLQGEFVPMAEPIVTYETFDHDIEVIGDKAYILSERILNVYAFDGATLTYESTIDLNSNQYDALCATNDGHLIVSATFADAKGFDDGVQSVSYSDVNHIEVAPSGDWGVSYFSSVTDFNKITFGDGGSVTKENIPIAELTNISDVWIDEENVFISGSSAEDSSHCVAVYDHSFNLKTILHKTSGATLGSASFVYGSDNGYMVIDGNMRTITLFNTDGSYIGKADDADLFSTSYPWFAEADVLDDGSILIIMTEKRADQSAMELVAFKLSGF